MTGGGFLRINRTYPTSSLYVRMLYVSVFTLPRDMNMSAHAEQPLRVLVVDDNRDFTDSVAALVKLKGHEVFVAYDPIEGLRLAHEVLPHLVFHDIGFSGMTGYEVARRLRNDTRFKNTMLIAVTGQDGPMAKRSSKEVGFDRHITKPIRYKSMLEVLAAAAVAQRSP